MRKQNMSWLLQRISGIAADVKRKTMVNEQGALQFCRAMLPLQDWRDTAPLRA